MPKTEEHMKFTKLLSKKLKNQDVYEWLMTVGFFPENYVLPPCFLVSKYPTFQNTVANYKPKTFCTNPSRLIHTQFPKGNYTDRVFGIIDPEIYCDIAFEFSKNWKKILEIIFDPKNTVSSYSFPIPLDSHNHGKIGKLRSGRMIYEFIEMAENDISAEAFQYSYIVKADVKNFYPSIYTHSLSWAFHSKKFIRPPKRRRLPNYIGNRIDRLFQYANDTKTNGIAIGPAISDVVSEVLLARVDKCFSQSVKPDHILAVRFKDDYRILCDSEETCKKIIKKLQTALKEYDLDLNEEKISISKLPDGLFRPWVSRYHSANPNPKEFYSYKKFKEVYLAVVAIDRELPGTGIVDRFLADIIKKDYTPNFEINRKVIPNILSLLMLLAKLRIKSFPKVLGVIESIIQTTKDPWYSEHIGKYLGSYLDELSQSEIENRYLIVWILYFMKSNNLDKQIKKVYPFKDVIVKTLQSNRSNVFNNCHRFKLYSGVKTVARNKSLLQHLDVFSPQ